MATVMVKLEENKIAMKNDEDKLGTNVDHVVDHSFDGIVEFVAVAEHQGFSAAARQLNCSTSHVSRQLAKLEQRLGCALVVRTTRKVNLTSQGSQYYQDCKALITGLQQANQTVADAQVSLSGTLKVSAAGTFAEMYVVPALIEFAKLHPELTVSVDFNSRYVNFVDEGFDFVIRYGKLSDSNLIAKRLVNRSMMAAASPDYVRENGEPLLPEELKHHSCIISNNDNWSFEHNSDSRRIKVNGRFHCNNANAVVEACRQGLGIAYLPRSNFVKGVEAGELLPVLANYWDTSISSWIVYQNRQFMPSRVRMAIDFLVDYFQDWRE